MNIEKTIYFFKEISKIPRESGNEEKIAAYLCEFAKTRHLTYRKDHKNNVYIKKETGTNPFLILQAHTDMVCEKAENKNFDFALDEIEVFEKNGYLYANETTLGADNGIGVAQILTILDSPIKTNIEAIFTTCEETTMEGAIHFDASILKGKMLLNLDGFEENTILIESASFHDLLLLDHYTQRKITKTLSYKITLSGLLGGHSGADIDKNRGNASILLAKFLKSITNIELASFSGGTKFNVIPSFATASFHTSIKEETLLNQMQNFMKQTKKDFKTLNLTLERTIISSILTNQESIDYLSSIINFKDGVYHYGKECPTTSLNLGVVDLENHTWKIGMRSSNKKEEKECLDYLKNFSTSYHFELKPIGYQPGFSSKINSPFITKLKKSHPYPLFKKPPLIKAVHFTVEAGFFQEKIKELEIAIISCNIKGAHTKKECVEIASIERTNQWIEALIKSL